MEAASLSQQIVDSVGIISELPSVTDILEQKLHPRNKFEQLAELAKKRRELDPELETLVQRTKHFTKRINPRRILDKNNIPPISTNYREMLNLSSRVSEVTGKHLSEIDPEFVKDGYVYVLRGDYPQLEKKGIFSFPFYKWGINLDQTLELLKGAELCHNWNFRVQNKLEELMWVHSNGGYENFISTTTNYEIARMHPKYKKDCGMVYVLKVPIERAFKNYGSVVDGHHEREILIVDYVLPEDIIAVIDPKKESFVDPRQFMG